MVQAARPKRMIVFAKTGISKRQKPVGRNTFMRKYRTFSEVTEEYYRNHPEEIDGFLKIAFEEYAKDNDAGALLSALRIISRVKGVSATADAAGITRKGLQKALSEQGNPRFENINAIMQALGYYLAPQKIDHTLDHP